MDSKNTFIVKDYIVDRKESVKVHFLLFTNAITTKQIKFMH